MRASIPSPSSSTAAITSVRSSSSIRGFVTVPPASVASEASLPPRSVPMLVPPRAWALVDPVTIPLQMESLWPV